MVGLVWLWLFYPRKLRAGGAQAGKTSIARQIGDQDVTESRNFWQGWHHGRLILSFNAAFKIAMYGVGTQEMALADGGNCTAGKCRFFC